MSKRAPTRAVARPGCGVADALRKGQRGEMGGIARSFSL